MEFFCWKNWIEKLGFLVCHVLSLTTDAAKEQFEHSQLVIVTSFAGKPFNLSQQLVSVSIYYNNKRPTGVGIRHEKPQKKKVSRKMTYGQVPDLVRENWSSSRTLRVWPSRSSGQIPEAIVWVSVIITECLAAAVVSAVTVFVAVFQPLTCWFVTDDAELLKSHHTIIKQIEGHQIDRNAASSLGQIGRRAYRELTSTEHSQVRPETVGPSKC